MKMHSVIALAGLLSGPVLAGEVLISHPYAQVSDSEFAEAIDYLVPKERASIMIGKEQNIRGFLADYFTYKAMAEAARQRGLDDSAKLDVQVRAYKNKVLSEALIEDYIANAKRPDFEMLAREAYAGKPELFVRPEQVNAEHILIAVKEDRTEDEALALASKLYQQLKQNPSAFSKLAAEYSDDPSVRNNDGKLGFFDRKRMVPEFSEKAFSMQAGEIGAPVKSKFGYHVIRVIERRAETKMPFDSVKRRLIQEEEKKFLDAKRDEIVAEFRGSDKIVVDEEAMARFIKKIQEEQNTQDRVK